LEDRALGIRPLITDSVEYLRQVTLAASTVKRTSCVKIALNKFGRYQPEEILALLLLQVAIKARTCLLRVVKECR
jgi:hypothetical protein